MCAGKRANCNSFCFAASDSLVRRSDFSLCAWPVVCDTSGHCSLVFFFSDMFVDAVTVMSSESMKCLSGVCVCSLVCLSLALFSSHLQKKKKENAPDVKLLKAESSGRRLRNSRYCNYSFYFSWKVVIPSMSYHHLCSSMSGVLPTWPPAPMAKDFEYVKATC